MMAREPVIGRILVVDDNEMNRDMLSRRLARRGHTVTVAQDGKTALDLTRSDSFDLILLDIMMPGIDGLEVLTTLREKYPAGDLPIIMATAKDESEDIVTALKLGANDYVTKPLDFPVVSARVQSQLSLKFANDALREAHARMKNDLDAAARVQKCMLPGDWIESHGVSCSWLYRPCDELAGDGLNFFQIGEEFIVFYLIDVSGHGVPAALLSFAVTNALSNQLREAAAGTTSADRMTVTSPGSVASRLNELFPMGAHADHFFTLVYAVLDLGSGSLRFACAGHPGPLVVDRHGNAGFHDKPGLPIGFMEKVSYEEVQLQLEQGDRVYFYSDGLYEEANPEGEQFGRERMAEVGSAQRQHSLAQSIDALIQSVESWCQVSNFSDDLTILALERSD